MVGLDLSAMDAQLIAYTAFLCKTFKPNKIYFTHVHRDLSIPPKIKQEFPELRIPMDEKMAKEIETNLKNNFSNLENYDTEVEVIEGSPAKTLIHRVDTKNVDLLILGKKTKSEGSGIIPKQVVRRCTSSVLFVNENPTHSLNRIVVPTDFSIYSKQALLEAISVSKDNENANIFIHHVYDIPTYGYGGSLYHNTKIEPLVRASTQEQYNEFIADVNFEKTHVAPIFNLNMNYAGAAYTYSIAKERDADLIITAAQGKSMIKRLLLGSYTEKLIDAVDDIPLLVVKEKIDREAWKRSSDGVTNIISNS